MTYTAKWGSKGFLISANKVVALESLKTSFALKADNNKDTSGTPSTNTTGRELQEITLETTYARALGTDPRAQIDEWYSLIGGINPLYINGKQFGADKMQLTNVDINDVQLTPKGEFLSIRVAIKLKEYQPQAAAISTKPATSNSSSTSTTNNGKELNKVAALSAKASTEDKQTLKPSGGYSGGGSR